MLPAQRCAVVAVAPPAVPLQLRFNPRSARAACAVPGSVPATARCRSIAASLCACSASPAGARRCASAACASATVQRCAQPLRSHRPRHELWSCSRLQRCAAPPHHSPALPSTALHSKWRLRIGLASALARAPYGCLHRPCSLQGVIDHGCDSAAYGRSGDTREHKRCACTPSRAHIPAFTASPTQIAGAPAPPQPTPTVQAVNDTSTPLYTAGVSTHSTLVSPCQYVEYHREYSKVPLCRCAGTTAADGRGGG